METPLPRPFDFSRDVFAFSNQVRALNPYRNDLYSLRCFIMSCNVHRFFKFARFDPSLPKVSEDEYRRLVRRVAGMAFYRDPLPEQRRVVIPGYADLRSFSAEQERAVKEGMGLRWPSLVTYRNWRMSFGATAKHQARVAQQIQVQLGRGLCDQLHVVDSRTGRGLDHSVLVFAAREREDALEFSCYDPNDPSAPILLIYEKIRRRFLMPRVAYFEGGPIFVYRLYYSPLR